MEKEKSMMPLVSMLRLLSFLSLFFLFALSVPTAFAKEPPVSTGTAEMTSPDEQESTYTLPYPGMLPDNPMYFLKDFRDTVIWFLISDPLKKAEFDLLQADKKLAAGMFLVQEKDNQTLAVKTIKQGQGSFADAIDRIQSAGEKGMDTAPFLEKLSSAAKKHQEVLEELYTQTENKEFSTLSKNVESFVKEVDKL